MIEGSKDEREADQTTRDDSRVESRARSLENDQVGLDVEDHVAQAEALLKESDARKKDPATTELEDDSVERRTSDEATPPAEDV